MLKLDHIARLFAKYDLNLECGLDCLFKLISDYSSGVTIAIMESTLETKKKITDNTISSVVMGIEKNILQLEKHAMIPHSKFQFDLLHRKIHFVAELYVTERNDKFYLPTDILIIETFADKFITDNFTQLIEDFKPDQSFNLMGKISAFQHGASHSVVDIIDSTGLCTMLLWKEQVKFTELLKVGDLVCIWRPYINCSEDILKLEYGSETIIYVLIDPVIPGPTSEPTRIENSHTLANSYILGQLISQDEGTPSSTIWTVKGEDGCISIQMNASISRDYVGSIIYINALEWSHNSISSKNKECKSTCRSMTYIVSAMEGILSASFLISVLSVAEAMKGDINHFYIDAFIQSVESSVINTHSICGNAVENLDGFEFCNTCEEFCVSNQERLRSIELKDNSAILVVTCTDKILRSFGQDKNHGVGYNIRASVIFWNGIYRIEAAIWIK